MATLSLRVAWLLCGLAAATASLCAQNLRDDIDLALDKARPALLAHLREAAQQATRPGELALLVLAALHDGVPTDDAGMAAAIKRLAAAKPDETYDLALRLMVLEACPTFPTREALAKRDTADLLDHRSSKGVFQYGRRPSGWDLSNTQYGTLGLRAAVALGQTVERTVFARIASHVGDQQDDYGGFGYANYHGNGRIGNASMTAAGIAVLAICRQQLGDSHAQARELDRRIARGWQWFAANAQVIGDPKQGWCLYFHYGLERAAILCDVTEVGTGTDWYAAGARMLLQEQLAGGGWRSLHDGMPGQHLAAGRGDLVPTSFAVLFLRRKFQKHAAAAVTPHVVTMAAIGPHSKEPDVQACAAELQRRGKAAMPEVLRALRSEIAPQRRAAAIALQAIAGDGFGFDAADSPEGERNRAAVRLAELWYLKNR